VWHAHEQFSPHHVGSAHERNFIHVRTQILRQTGSAERRILGYRLRRCFRQQRCQGCLQTNGSGQRQKSGQPQRHREGKRPHLARQHVVQRKRTQTGPVQIQGMGQTQLQAQRRRTHRMRRTVRTQCHWLFKRNQSGQQRQDIQLDGQQPHFQRNFVLLPELEVETRLQPRLQRDVSQGRMPPARLERRHYSGAFGSLWRILAGLCEVSERRREQTGSVLRRQ
jgi:hypothetical protein